MTTCSLPWCQGCDLDETDETTGLAVTVHAAMFGHWSVSASETDLGPEIGPLFGPLELGYHGPTDLDLAAGQQLLTDLSAALDRMRTIVIS